MTPERRAELRTGFLGAGITRTELLWLLDRADDAERLEVDWVQLNSTNLATIKEAGHLSFTAWLNETQQLRAEVGQLRGALFEWERRC